MIKIGMVTTRVPMGEQRNGNELQREGDVVLVMIDNGLRFAGVFNSPELYWRAAVLMC